MELGKINTLRVLRETDISYLLTDGLEEVFLHKKEALRPYKDHEEIDVFIYKDNEGRLTASTKTPKLTLGGFAKLKVVGSHPTYGVFLDYGLVKDLLLSVDDLPERKEAWPVVGDACFVTMKISKERLFAHIPSRNELSNRFDREESMPDELETLTITITHFLSNGVAGYSDDGLEVFIHRNNYRRQLRLGETIEVNIIQKNERNYSGQLIEQKEIMLDEDSQRILDYLNEHGGRMNFTDKSEPEHISRVFHMSKSAFKRALGKLYRERKVVLSETQTRIKR